MAALGSVFAGVVAVAALKWYLWDVLIAQADEADRSMAFWGLPIAFLGLVCLVAAVTLAWTARSMIRRQDP